MLFSCPFPLLYAIDDIGLGVVLTSLSLSFSPPFLELPPTLFALALEYLSPSGVPGGLCAFGPIELFRVVPTVGVVALLPEATSAIAALLALIALTGLGSLSAVANPDDREGPATGADDNVVDRLDGSGEPAVAEDATVVPAFEVCVDDEELGKFADLTVAVDPLELCDNDGDTSSPVDGEIYGLADIARVGLEVDDDADAECNAPKSNIPAVIVALLPPLPLDSEGGTTALAC